MPARQRGNLKDLERRTRRGIERGLRDLTQLTKTEVQKENPVDTGRSRSAWAAKFNAGRLTGVVGNKTKYIRYVAEGLRYVAEGRRGHMSAKQRRNVGFHQRGADKAMQRAPELLARALKKAGVPLR